VLLAFQVDGALLERDQVGPAAAHAVAHRHGQPKSSITPIACATASPTRTARSARVHWLAADRRFRLGIHDHALRGEVRQVLIGRLMTIVRSAVSARP
jgi:hypothetical protein